ncbi:TetR/AcrR family transcriptional regulator [Paenibacillus flagellatus]|uniref:TetR/AcrR family transcriptional regulator n=1 Tax=Paenibacillus flagellatus TaxID=2211139 RepID=A0A2V5KTP8_9BACL|nr:TetR/AcrR family transcriptional regulator [Paenibacillus flagellatus]PYI52636.1 TetR/AcrR family transcriptional regulator [Paenibacillus flagellatus]
MARVTKNPEERKTEILLAAERLFQSKGYERTAVSDIVKHVGVAQGTFYYYFKSKEEIADALIDRMVERQMEIIRRIADDSSLPGYEKMVRVVTDVFMRRGENLDAEEYLHHESNALLHQKSLVKTVQAYTPVLTSIVEQGVREGAFRTEHPREAVEFFLVGVLFLFDPGIFPWTPDELETKLQAVGETMEKLFGADKGAFAVKRLSPNAIPLLDRRKRIESPNP